jgi:TPR repeat protein/tRNA A-37 threonylcarbamoyl transferase component Bud32
LGDFEIRSLLGRGATSTVYEARWGPRTVALKVFDATRGDTGRLRQRFVLEAERLAAIEHAGVVKVLHHGTFDDGTPYLVMEKLSGETAAVRIARGALSWAQSQSIFRQIAEAVMALHGAGLIHRDIKPENVFLIDGGRHAVLLDVGIAKDLEEQRVQVTSESAVVGTPAYMAPERLFGKPASVQSDVYELGLLLYMFLSGRLPWDRAASPTERLEPASLSVHCPEAPREVVAVVDAAISARVEERPAGVAAVCSRLGIDAPEASALELAMAPTAVRPAASTAAPPSGDAIDASATAPTNVAPTAVETASGPVRRGRRWILVVLAALAAGGGAATLLAVYSRQAVGPTVVDPQVLLRQRCDQGDSADCYELARSFRDGKEVFQSDELARAMFRRACQLSRGPYGCEEIAFSALEAEAEGGKLEALGYLELACEAGKSKACSRLAEHFRTGTLVAKNVDRAAVLDRRGCDGDIAASCVSLGYSLSTGRGVDVDVQAAVLRYRKACDLENALGCYNLAICKGDGRGTNKDLEEALRLHGKACELGMGDGCARRAEMVRDGDGTRPDQEKAIALFKKGCEHDSAGACFQLGHIFQKGQGVAISMSDAADYFDSGCRLGSLGACNNLAVMREGGQGGPVALDEAARLYRRACDGNSQVGCRNLARITAAGSGVEKDPARARSLDEKACRLGNEVSCRILKREKR